MKSLDFLVIAAYAIGMLAVGCYFARRTDSTEQYLLGGRRMNPVMIGLSLFATLASTLSYLMLPGELIQYGPMVFAQVASYPIVAILVGWWLIPAIMRFKVTSAYELLESQLGVGGRLLGAAMFVLLRLVWMAAILYATSDKVLIPILGLSSQTTPIACLVLGLITVVYTMEGGLRAVVVTDAAQSIVMLVGAAVCVFVVSEQLGGIDAWWPEEWHEHWDELVWWDASAAHIPLIGAFVNMLVWLTCTSGSDQVAVQRYLATRDARAARRSFIISLVADVAVQAVLALAGLAVLAYFLARPNDFSPDMSVLEAADRAFPRFIVTGLPAGLTGLLIAALLSAAMSSLSSGVNSSCAVIATDFVSRWRSKSSAAVGGVREARCIALAVGVLTIAFSTVMQHVPGNLLEVCFTAVNLLTTPLFVLFFLAMFVPWSSPIGAYLATAASVLAAVGVGFFGWFGLGFLWMGCCSLVAGVFVGMVASFVFPTRWK